MTDDLREAVARALCEQGQFDPDEIMPNDGPRWRYYLEAADAAIAVVVERLCDPAAVISAQERVLHDMRCRNPKISKHWLREYHERMVRALAQKEEQ